MGASNHLLDFDTSLFRTSSRRLRRLFFRGPSHFPGSRAVAHAPGIWRKPAL